MTNQTSHIHTHHSDDSHLPVRSRSIRGDNSIVERVSQQLNECEEIIDELERDFSLSGQDLYSFLSEMAQAAAAAEQTIEPLIELESDIQVLKDEFPGYKALLEIDDQIARLHQSGEIDAANNIEQNHAPDLKLFRRRRNEIEERVLIAREYRLAFLTQQRRLSMLQHSLARLQQMTLANNILAKLKDGPTSQNNIQDHVSWLHSCCDKPPFIPKPNDENKSVQDQITSLESDISLIENDLQTHRQHSLPRLVEIESQVLNA